MQKLFQFKFKLMVPALMAAGVLAGCSSSPDGGGMSLSPVTCGVLGAIVGGAAGATADTEAAVGGALLAGTIGAILCAEEPAAAEPEPLDSDGDGVEDMYDDCPATPAGAEVDGMGCPLDSDGDGVADYMDECPDTLAGTKVDAKGCPVPVVVEDYCEKWVVLEDGKVVGYQPIGFAVNVSAFAESDHPELNCIADALSQQRNRLLIEGHTDNIGEADYNQGLSEKRAAMVRDYLIDQGVPAGDVESVGYGETRPAYTNKTNVGRAGNRRVEFKIIE